MSAALDSAVAGSNFGQCMKFEVSLLLVGGYIFFLSFFVSFFD
jgi:hypothetical protein